MLQHVRRAATAAAIIGFSAFVSLPVNAATQNDRRLFAAPAYTAATAPNARLAAFISNAAVTRSKGVVAYSHPAVGQYCLKPSSSINLANVVPAVSIDWSNSLGNSLLAYYRSSGSGCPAGYLNIVTYTFAAGSDPVLSDSVAFTVIVP